MTLNSTELKKLIITYLKNGDEQSKAVLFDYLIKLTERVLSRYKNILGFEELYDVKMAIVLKLIEKVILDIILHKIENIEAYLYKVIKNAIIQQAKTLNKKNYVDIEKVSGLRLEEIDEADQALNEKKEKLAKGFISGTLRGLEQKCMDFFSGLLIEKTEKEILKDIKTTKIYPNDNTMFKKKNDCKKKIIRLIQEHLKQQE